jgi:hypothetical protein
MKTLVLGFLSQLDQLTRLPSAQRRRIVHCPLHELHVRISQQRNQLSTEAVVKRRENMNDLKTSTTTTEEQPLPIALFKNSLRQWQARWKAQQTDAPAALRRIKSRLIKRGRKTASAQASAVG